MPSTTTSRRRIRKPVLHSVAVKLAAVKEARQLIRNGMSKSKAFAQIGKGLKVSAATLHNWVNKYGTLTLNHTNGRMTNKHTNGDLVTSVDVNTAAGIVKLTPIDIKNIASLAGTVC